MEEYLTKKNQEENHYDASYLEFIKQETDIENILKEIQQVFASNINKAEAEKIIMGELGDKMTNALVNSKQALEKWLNDLKKLD